MRIVALGVRGSTPAPGREFVEFGGHTSAVAVLGDDDAQPRLILDAGTGLRTLPALMAGRPFAGDVVLTHLHWDHVQGLPFCPAVDHPDARVRLHVPTASADVDAEALLARALSPPHFPIDPSGLLGRWSFVGASPGPLALADGAVARVCVGPVAHKGGLTYGVRVEQDGAALAYLPDHALADVDGADDAAVALARGVDLLVHDGQYLAAEAAVAADYGHATIDAALAFADRCGVGAVLLTHHAPGRTDAALQHFADTVTHSPGGVPVRFARQDEPVPVVPCAGASGVDN